MKLTKKKLLKLINENIQEMSMTFNSSDRPHPSIQASLASQDTPLKKIPFPQSNVPGQNFQELLASEVYRDVVEKVKHYTGLESIPGVPTLQGLTMDSFQKIINAENGKKNELERFAVESVLNAFKIPHDAINIHATLATPTFGAISTKGFIEKKPADRNINAPDISGEEVPEDIDINEPLGVDVEVEKKYLDSLEDFDLERAKRRLLNAMTQGASHQSYSIMTYSEIANGVRRIIGPLPGGGDIMNLYSYLMSMCYLLYWQISDESIKKMQMTFVTGKSDVKFPNSESDDNDEGGGDGDDEEGQGGGTDTLGNPIDPEKPQIYASALSFPTLFHEIIKGVQKVRMGFSKIKGFDPQNPKHADYYERLKNLEDVIDYEVWDLRLGPAIWRRYIAAHPTHVIDPDQKIELQGFVQSYVYELPPRKFLSLMREIMTGSDRSKRIIENLVKAIEKMLADQDYDDEISQYEDLVDNVNDETNNDDISKMINGILRKNNINPTEDDINNLINGSFKDDDEEDDDDEEGGELVPVRR